MVVVAEMAGVAIPAVGNGTEMPSWWRSLQAPNQALQ